MKDTDIVRQLAIVTQLFEQTLEQYPHCWCQRDPGRKMSQKDWKTFFIEFEYQDLSLINQQWIIEDGRRQTRFSKRRELHWIDAEHLLFIYQHHPEKLWKKVRQLVNARLTIQCIQEEKLSSES